MIIIGIILLLFLWRKFKSNFDGPDGPDGDYPELVEIDDFLTPEECNRIIELADPKMVRSQVMGNTTTNDRTSSNTFLPYKLDPVVSKVINKSCELTFMPIINAEELQVVRYGKSQEYRPHFDACDTKKKECSGDYKRGGMRHVTVLIYLSDKFAGGGTTFPMLKKTVVPKVGKAVVFYNLTSDGRRPHPMSLHGGDPVLDDGIKYVANIWIRQKQFK